MSRTAALAALALLLCAALPAAAQDERPSSGPVVVTALAVSQTAQGFVGVHAEVSATVIGGGSGQVFVSTKPLAGTDMQGSARLASQVAASTLGLDWRRQDYLVSFRSESTVIGGPSAGAVMALGLAVALHNLERPDDPWTVDPRVAATGTINPDGTIGPVGGVAAKAEAAAAAGVTTFLFPAGLEQAPNLEGGPGGLRWVDVDMGSHCAGLGIACRAAASLRDVLEAAAGVRLDEPDVAAPGTGDYRQVLGPSVRADVEGLAERVGRFDVSPLSGSALTLAEEQAGLARDRMTRSQEALDAEQYYLAATRSFQGHIYAGRAENLTRFHAEGRSEAVVTDALADCRAAADEAREASYPLSADGLNELYAVGSAQVRAAEAASILADAERRHAQAFSFDDWVESLFNSVFCVERAHTSLWWAGLRSAFGPGPQAGSPEDLARDRIDQAQDMLAYTEAVLGSSLAAASQRLQDAMLHLQEGRPAAAILLAIEAESLASVSLQTADGDEVPPAVLEAAEQAAARAIGAARGHGAEPLLSVSLVELAADQQDGATALQTLWTARSAALLETGAGGEPVGYRRVRSTEGPAAALLGIGALVGAGLVAVAWALVPPRRRA